MKKILICILLIFFGSLPAYAMSGDALDDSCADFSKVYEKSEYWQVKTDNEARYSDADRFHKTIASAQISEPQYLTYMYGNIGSCEVYFYYTDANILNMIKIKYSSDNETWTEATVKNSSYSGCTGSWKGSIIKADNLPKGTKYIKIELEKNAKPTSCCIGRVILTKRASDYMNTPMAEPGESEIYVEECDSLDGVYERSANWAVDKNNAEVMGGDGGRYVRTASYQVGEYLTFKVPNMQSVDFTYFHMESSSLEEPTFLKAEFSPDNETWYEASITIKQDFGQISTWKGKLLTVQTDGKPANYMKLTVGDIGSNAEWAICFGKFTFTADSYYNEPEGTTTVEDGTVYAIYDLPTNFNLYDKVTMYIAMYDADGILTGLYQQTADAAESGESIYFEYEVPLAENTATVKTYFWNALCGMHRLAETKTLII